MKEFLRKVKIVDNLKTEIEIQKTEFVSRFRKNVDEGSIGFMSDTFDIFSSSENQFKGHVGYDSFKIKRKKRFFDMNLNFAVAEGSYRQRESTLIIEAEINGLSGMIVPFYIIAIVFYTIFILTLFFADNTEGNGTVVALPFIIFHAAVMLGIPYFIMRRSTSRLKYDLEREFFYLTKNSSPLNVG
jgi:hypothetical protein